MKLGDLTVKDLITAGWSKEDILILAKSDTDSTQTNTEPTQTNTETHTDVNNSTQADTEHTQKDTEPTQTNAEVDELKTALENIKAELTQTKQALQTAQAVNRTQNFGNNNNETDEDIFNKFVQSY